jgi:hypothetical protein
VKASKEGSRQGKRERREIRELQFSKTPSQEVREKREQAFS